MEKTINELTVEIEKVVNENPRPIAGMKVVYQFDLTDDEAFQLHLADGQAKVVHDTSAPADCTLQMSGKNFRKFMTGKLNGTMAFMTGKLKIKGDLAKAMKLESVLNQYQFNIN